MSQQEPPFPEDEKVKEREDYDGFGDYLTVKRQKLLEQQNSITVKGSLFTGLRFHVNGYTDPPASVLKELVVSQGGIYERYYYHRPDIYMIATHLPKAKTDKMTPNQIVIRPEWVKDCIEQGKLLDISGYRLYNTEGKEGERALDSGFVKKRDTEEKGRTTASDPNFVQNFYKSSRLHHLSAWREELKAFAKELMQNKEHEANKDSNVNEDEAMVQQPQWIMHIDMDCFFASVCTRDRPDLAGKPVGISHSAANQGKEGSSSDLASVNYEARKFGLSNGMYTRRALELCPDLVILPYDFEAYQEVAYDLYRVLARHAEVLQAVSCDEAFIAVNGDGEAVDRLAKEIRDEISLVCRCPASIGIGENILLARLATKKAKPNGQFRVNPEEAEAFMAEQKLSDLPGVGPSISAKLQEQGWNLCSDLESVHLERLQALLGPKLGKSVFEHAHGIDHRALDGVQQRKSVGTEISWGVRLETEDQLKHFVLEMTREVITRLTAIGDNLTSNKMQVKLMKRQMDAKEPSKRLGRGMCDFLHKTVPLKGKLTAESLAAEAIRAIQSYSVPIEDIRGIGIFLLNLEETVKGYNWSSLSLAKPKRSLFSSKDSYLEARGYLPEVFAELDPQVQEDLLHEWGYYNEAVSESANETPKKILRTTPVKARKKTPTKSYATIPQLFQKRRSVELQEVVNAHAHAPSRGELVEMGIDPDFYEALPDCIKQEILSSANEGDKTTEIIENIDDEKPEVVELLESCTANETFDFNAVSDFSHDSVWKHVHNLLGTHDYETASKLLNRIKDRQGAAQLIERVQAWFMEHTGAILYIP